MLHDLLRIKKIREDSAQTEVKKCQYRVEQAARELDQKKKSLSDYIEWRRKEEVALYDKVINAQVKQNALDLLKQKIAKLREHDLQIEQQIRDAEAQLEQKKSELEQAKQNLIEAQKAVEKFQVFTDELKEQELKEQERIIELEMEEFVNKNKNY